MAEPDFARWWATGGAPTVVYVRARAFVTFGDSVDIFVAYFKEKKSEFGDGTQTDENQKSCWGGENGTKKKSEQELQISVNENEKREQILSFFFFCGEHTEISSHIHNFQFLGVPFFVSLTLARKGLMAIHFCFRFSFVLWVRL